MLLYFNPRSPHGERPAVISCHKYKCTFQSTLPARGATFRDGSHLSAWGISIHAPRTGSDCRCRQIPRQHTISIHAPRTGSDAPTSVISGEHRNFNPRSPHGERLAAAAVLLARTYFNPRSPHGERRDALCCVGGDVTDISIHAPRTGSDERREHLVPLTGISIHAPRTGSDWDGRGGTLMEMVFQSTLPARGATNSIRPRWALC